MNNAPTNPISNQSSYSIVNVHPWSTGTAGGGTGNPMSNVKYIVDNLDADVEVVTLEELMIHLHNNYGNFAASPTLGKTRAQRQVSKRRRLAIPADRRIGFTRRRRAHCSL